MKFLENDTTITIENNKGDFEFSFLMQKGASWAQAKQSAAECYEQIVRMEYEAILKQQAEAANAAPATDVVAEVVENPAAPSEQA
jgi:hypothetical protein